MLFVGAQAVLDNLAIGAVLFQLCGALGQRRRAPETLRDGLALLHHLILLKQLGEQDVQGADEHDEHDQEGHLRDDPAFAQRGEQTVGAVAFFHDACRSRHQAEAAFVATGSGSSGNQIEHCFTSLSKIKNG